MKSSKLKKIQELKDTNNLTKTEAEKIVTRFFDQMSEALVQGDRVEIRGLCSIFVKRYGGYTGRIMKLFLTLKCPKLLML